MNLPKVMLLSQCHLEHQGIVTLVEASRKQLRLAILLSTEQNPSATTAGNKFTQRESERALGVCFYCKKNLGVPS